MVPQPAWLQFGWRDIPTFVGIVAALAFSLSVMRSIGFFGILDLKLLPLLSTDDMLRDSLAALPAVAGAAGILLAPIVIIYQRLPTLFQLCVKNAAWLIVATVIALLGGAVLFGANEARVALTTDKPNYELSLTTGETLRVKLLSVTSDTLIVMQNPTEISVVPRGQVKLLKPLNLPPTQPDGELSSSPFNPLTPLCPRSPSHKSAMQMASRSRMSIHARTRMMPTWPRC